MYGGEEVDLNHKRGSSFTASGINKDCCNQNEDDNGSTDAKLITKQAHDEIDKPPQPNNIIRKPTSKV